MLFIYLETLKISVSSIYHNKYQHKNSKMPQISTFRKYYYRMKNLIIGLSLQRGQIGLYPKVMQVGYLSSDNYSWQLHNEIARHSRQNKSDKQSYPPKPTQISDLIPVSSLNAYDWIGNLAVCFL